jgi:ADP-heptose:LPS heptosyltransferase
VAEQGLGDTLQFSRFCERVRREHEPASITVQVHPRLRPLLAALPGVDHVISLKAPTPAHDVWAGLMSLPLLSGAAACAELRQPRCFEAVQTRRATWRELLPPRRSRRIAIAWQGNPGYAGDAERSIPLAHFIPLLSDVEGLDLISLQAGDGLDQIGAYADTDGFHTLDGPLDADGAFLDSAAILSACDLLLSSDTSIVHLAASMGVPTWVPTAYAPDWRWAGHDQSSPWYDAVRLFRQPTAGDWPAVFQQITSALQELPP